MSIQFESDGGADERHCDRSLVREAGRRMRHRRLGLRAAIAATALSLAVGMVSIGEARAERVVQIGAQKRSVTVPVYIGKSEDVRTDTSFTEITVGDPEVADVNPLTDRALSILGKK